MNILETIEGSSQDVGFTKPINFSYRQLGKSHKGTRFSKAKNQGASKYCPNCGAVLKDRIGKFGNFLGCSRFPKCGYTFKKIGL